jgi:hypothetical protein
MGLVGLEFLYDINKTYTKRSKHELTAIKGVIHVQAVVCKYPPCAATRKRARNLDIVLICFKENLGTNIF